VASCPLPSLLLAVPSERILAASPVADRILCPDGGSAWLPESVAVDAGGYVVTGPDAVRGIAAPAAAPLLLETSLPGVFAAGDVRSGSVKRVASAVGEGAMAVRLVHEHLATAR
jgi:thioredoxin reductase